MKFDSYLSHLCRFARNEKSGVIGIRARLFADAIIFCLFFWFRWYRTDTTTRVFPQLKRTAMRGTFYECDTASLVSSTVDIGDCRVRSVVGEEVRYRAEYTIMAHGTSGSERKRVDWASSLSRVSDCHQVLLLFRQWPHYVGSIAH